MAVRVGSTVSLLSASFMAACSPTLAWVGVYLGLKADIFVAAGNLEDW